MTKSYDASNIQVLQNVDHIRQRPNMYIADTKSAGMHQLIKEIIDNSVDEHLAGHCKEIYVSLDAAENRVTIIDDGRGIPVSLQPQTGISALATVFLIAGAGGKFNSDSYSTSAGLHGVGVTVCNALSSVLDVISVRDGGAHKLTFHRGVCVQKDSKPELLEAPYSAASAAVLMKRGTLVSFVPDESIFKGLKFEPDRIRLLLQNIAYLNSDLRLTFSLTADSDGTSLEEVFHETGGLASYVTKQVESEDSSLHDVVHVKNDWFEAAFVWTDANNEQWSSFANSSLTPEGGTHVTGFKRSITNNLGPKATKAIETDDLRTGLIAAVHVKVKEPQFKGQTKDRLMNRETESAVYDVMKDVLNDFVTKNTKVVDAIVARAVKIKSARDKFVKEKDASKAVVLVKKDKKGVLPGKLFEAPNCKPVERELYLCEGDSAGGGAKLARFQYNQEVLALKGKIPNALTKSRSMILENEELSNIITCVSAGIGDKCNPSKSRVGKILLLMDADPDGQHITALMLAFFQTYMPQVIEAGMLHIVNSPLFRGKWKDKNYFGNTIDEIKQKLPGNASPSITRLKGHGECRMEELREYAMDPATRSLTMVTLDSLSNQRLSELLGSDAGVRKTLLGLSD